MIPSVTVVGACGSGEAFAKSKSSSNAESKLNCCSEGGAELDIKPIASSNALTPDTVGASDCDTIWISDTVSVEGLCIDETIAPLFSAPMEG